MSLHFCNFLYLVSAFVPSGRVHSTGLKMAFESAEGAQAPLGFWDPLGLLKDADQERFDKSTKSILRGNRIAITSIDTAMFVVHKHHIQNIKWREHEYSADAYFIIDINKKNISCHKYINRVLSYYNFLLK